mmetsp:Transcript_103817/g.317955  ORF Transcript_103817/g.317955 Transcript_103817/m.317955 type:complete len:238 (-) Transcript_103817:174-887(-)
MGHFSVEAGRSSNSPKGGSYRSFSTTGMQPAKKVWKNLDDHALLPRGTKQNNELVSPKNESMYGTSTSTCMSGSASRMASSTDRTFRGQDAFWQSFGSITEAWGGRGQPTKWPKKGRSSKGLARRPKPCMSSTVSRPGTMMSLCGLKDGFTTSGYGFQSSVSVIRKTALGTQARQFGNGPSAPMPEPQTNTWSLPPSVLWKCLESFSARSKSAPVGSHSCFVSQPSNVSAWLIKHAV